MKVKTYSSNAKDNQEPSLEIHIRSKKLVVLQTSRIKNCAPVNALFHPTFIFLGWKEKRL